MEVLTTLAKLAIELYIEYGSVRQIKITNCKSRQGVDDYIYKCPDEIYTSDVLKSINRDIYDSHTPLAKAAKAYASLRIQEQQIQEAKDNFQDSLGNFYYNYGNPDFFLENMDEAIKYYEYGNT